MRILVTGGAGFIGSNIVDGYIAAGHDVLVVDDFSTGREGNLNAKARVERMDIVSPALHELVRAWRPDVVSHHAAQIDVRRSYRDPQCDIRVNVSGTVNLLEAVRTIRGAKVIFASSGGAIYGDGDPIPASEDHEKRPLSPYGLDKLVGELYLRYYADAHGLRFAALRYANVYGPRQDPLGEAGVVAIFTMRMLRGERVTINGDGGQTRDYVFVGDVVEANTLALDDGREGVLNIGTGVETTVNQIFGYLAEEIEGAPPPAYGPPKDGEQRRSALDCAFAGSRWGWRARTPIRGGLRRTVDFFRAAGESERH